MSLLRAENLTKSYRMGRRVVPVLRKVSFEVEESDFLALRGASGAGKSTLLHLLGGLDTVDEGEIWFRGQNLTTLPPRLMAEFRNKNIGFVFQGYNLIAPLNALQNVMLPLELMNVPAKEAKEKAILALKKVTMEDRMKNLPRALSGGQQQRVAIARALVSNPSLILCDEPTASLDPSSVDIVMGELKSLVSANKCVVIVTHDMRLRPYADRIVYVDNGNVLTEEPKSEYAH